MKLSRQEIKKFNAWNNKYKPTEWEIERNNRIVKKQGNYNQFIK